MRIAAAVLFLGALALPAPTAAQTEEDAVRAVVDGLFDAMRAGDSLAVRALFHPQARLITAGMREGVPTLRAEDSVDGFVEAVGTPHDEVWDERIDDVKIRVDGPLASAWLDYGFFLGETFSHCGVDAFLLFRAPEGWQIVSIADTRRREGCEKWID
ncbi:MAG TPA: nuclear transport factor 2 family protein [Gemmatimonadota bacterium]|nr:nuclear transport factor 2 family protein [Gemmatimonadota bacterium]